MTRKSYWIKERHNPQFKGPYHVPCGQLSKRQAKQIENNTLYGVNIMLEYKTKEEYDEAKEKFKKKGSLLHG